MSAAPSTTSTVATRPGRSPLLAAATAAAFAAEAVVAALHPANLADHATGAGRVSEALAGLAFLLAAGALAAYAGSPRWLFLPAVLGCAAMGVAQLDIAARGEEWPDPLVTGIVLLAFVGLVLAGVVGGRARVWPWWGAVLLAVVVPALFLVPSPGNSAVLAAIWATLAVVTRRR